MLFGKRKPAGPVDFMVVGLGNPGRQYEGTRHNAGFAVIEALAASLGVRVDRVRFKAYTGQANIDGTRVLLLMPQTYMNNSGQAVTEAMRFYKLPPERVLLVADDVCLPVGRLRIRRKGSDGGQKGLRSIITLAGSDAFPRIKLGVGEKPHLDYDLADWVLSRFTKEEAPLFLDTVNKAVQAVRLMAVGDIDTAMNRYST